MPLKVRIGDIIEIPTSKGLAYAQYAHRVKGFGYLIRILDGVFKTRPGDFSELVNKKHRFVTIFPLGAAVNRGIFNVVVNVDVPEEARDFPLFRAAGATTREGKVIDWWLWDGEKSWRVGHLTPEQYKLPIQSIPGVPVLLEMIEEGWEPETDKWRGFQSQPTLK